ncbi:MAG: UDP-3-O-[3-hydroxymyristoyl] glucosamine N-acyltransferase, partial [Granulosicoccus sp.]
MEFSAKIIASMLGGEVVGNEEVMVSQVSRIEEGESGGLCFLANPKYEQYIYTT